MREQAVVTPPHTGGVREPSSGGVAGKREAWGHFAAAVAA